MWKFFVYDSGSIIEHSERVFRKTFLLHPLRERTFFPPSSFSILSSVVRVKSALGDENYCSNKDDFRRLLSEAKRDKFQLLKLTVLLTI